MLRSFVVSQPFGKRGWGWPAQQCTTDVHVRYTTICTLRCMFVTKCIYAEIHSIFVTARQKDLNNISGPKPPEGKLTTKLSIKAFYAARKRKHTPKYIFG